MAKQRRRGRFVERDLVLAGDPNGLSSCAAEEITTITGHSLRTVHAIIDAHDLWLADEAIAKLERKGAETPIVKRSTRSTVKRVPTP